MQIDNFQLWMDVERFALLCGVLSGEVVRSTWYIQNIDRNALSLQKDHL